MNGWERLSERINILKSLNIAKRDHHPALLWQTPNDQEGRILCNVRVVDIDESTGEIVLVPEGSIYPRELDSRLPFFIRCSHRSLLFKAHGAFEGEALVIKLPDEIMMRENRSDPRLSYGADSTHRAILRKVDQGIISQDTFTLPLYDVGPGGYSVTVSEQESSIFYPDDLVVVDQLGALTFAEPLRSHWKYLIRMEEVRPLKGRAFRMGLEFDRKVAFELLQTLPYADW